MKPYRKAYVEWRKAYLEAVLAQYGGNVNKASKFSGVNRSVFYEHGVKSTMRPFKPVDPNEGNAEWRALQ